MSDLIYVILLNFLIGFVSDIGLNYLSRQTYSPEPVKALEVYFKRKSAGAEPFSTLISAANAGLTIVVCLVIVMFLSKILFGFYFPLKFKQILPYIPLTFLVGYFADVLIYKTQLFGPSLNPYYEATGAGLWGALAFIFSVLLSYALMAFFYKKLLAIHPL
jgi:hypothetical protein